MAGELQTDFLAGQTVYFLLRSSVGTVWNTSSLAFEAYATANYANYVIAATQQGSASGYYTAGIPAVPTGVYSATAKQQIGGSPAESDFSAGDGTIYWDGTNSITPFLPVNFGLLGVNSAGRVSILTGFTKNIAVPNFEFKMTLLNTNTPATGLTITATRSIDGGAFGGTSNAASEVADGIYVINLSAADLNGGVITFNFNGGATANVTDVTVRTDP